eukprot:SAG31_NODE_3163_length_4605_cov_15.046383_2_plen_238_part_00
MNTVVQQFEVALNDLSHGTHQRCACAHLCPREPPTQTTRCHRRQAAVQSRLRGITFRMARRNVTQAFNACKELWWHKKRMKNMTRQCLQRFKNRTLAVVFQTMRSFALTSLHKRLKREIRNANDRYGTQIPGKDDSTMTRSIRDSVNDQVHSEIRSTDEKMFRQWTKRSFKFMDEQMEQTARIQQVAITATFVFGSHRMPQHHLHKILSDSILLVVTSCMSMLHVSGAVICRIICAH